MSSMYAGTPHARRPLARRTAILLCLVAALLPLARPWRALASAKNPKGSIADFANRPGDQVVVVPDGTYTGGSVRASHPVTDGPYKGWLVLVAQTPRGVVVDLSETGLSLEVGSSRVLFVGFKFVNGTLSVRGDDIAFWHTEHTFPVEEWNRQFQAAGGNAPALKRMENSVPKAIWIGDRTQGHTVQRTRILGADIHDVGDDAVFVDKSQGAVMQGDRIWNIDKKTFDPGVNPWVPSSNVWLSNASVHIPGAVSNFTMADSYVGQTISVGGNNASATDLRWDDLWVARGDGVGMLFYANPGYRVSGSMRDIRAWSNGYKQKRYDSGWDQIRVDIVDGRQVSWPGTLNDPRLDIPSAGTNLNQQAPTGVTMSGGRMLDESQALGHPQNPANTWRDAHPYTSWRDYFGFPAIDMAAPAVAPTTSAPTVPPPAAAATTDATTPPVASPGPAAVPAPAIPVATTAPPAKPSVTMVAASRPQSGSITDLVRMPGDQAIVVPDGTYTGGHVTAPHPATAGPLKGWLVLVAQSPHGVTVDMSKGGLVLDAATSRVLFVGFKFVNGTVVVRGDDITFWHTEHTFPIEEWNRQFQSAGGNAKALRTMEENAAPKAIWIGNETNRTVQRTQILGADIHDVGDDAVFVDKSQGAVMQGDRMWKIDKKNFDPGYNPWNPSIKAWIHNDSVQIPGAVSDFTMADSYVGQTITVGGDNANADNLQWKRLWVAGADGVGMLFYTQNGYRVTGSMQDIRSWSNGFKQNPYDSGWDQLRLDIVDGRIATWPASSGSARLDIASRGANRNQQAPSGVTMAGGRMLDPSQALDSPQNPANVWRAAHPYASWPGYFGLNVQVPASPREPLPNS